MTTSTATEPLSLSTGSNSSRLEPIDVEAIDGPGTGPELCLRSGTITVGSGADCDLRLDDPKISRRHASIELLRGAVRLSDLGSRNGTLYLGARITQAVIPAGGVVRIGQTSVRFSKPRTAPESDRTELAGLIGKSRPMRQLFAKLERVAPSESTVLICGETGTGKDAVARAIHALSPRSSGPWVVFDCAAVNPELLESELFGHVKGAFTHALADHAGALERADGGTLLFDEIGELPLELQPKLLRALDEHEYRPVGSSRTRKVSARILAATHRDLLTEVRERRFREDLYFRLAVLVIKVPPLRARLDDIPMLTRHFAKEHATSGTHLDWMTVASFLSGRMPGNVRQLRNAVERTVALGTAEVQATSDRDLAFKAARERLCYEFEREYLAHIIKQCGGNISEAVRASGLSRSQFYRLLRQHRDDPGAPWTDQP